MTSNQDPIEDATAYNVQLSASQTPGDTSVDHLQQESADKASELLMLNHAKYHTLFDDVGLHNHTVHHLLSIYALGASPAEIQQAYDLNKGYQVNVIHHSPSVSASLSQPTSFTQYLGDPDHYSDYLKFFQDEIDQNGIEATLNEYLFKGDERADDMLGRLHSGFEHPILHLGFGLEFKQPCIVAEALASAAIHDDWPLPILIPAEQIAKQSQSKESDTSILSIIEDIRRDPVVSNAVKNRDPPNKIADGLVNRALKELVSHLARYRISSASDLSRKTAEMQQACVFLSGVSQKPGKAVSIEFFMMHSTNLSIFYPTFMKQTYMSDAAKIRLLEWKVRMDLTMYAGCRCPDLYLDRVRDYQPKVPGDWLNLYARARRYRDDGHTAKLIRALRAGEVSSRPYIGQQGFLLGRRDYLQIAHMTMDSVERMDENGYQIPKLARRLYIEGLGQSEEVVRIVVRWVRWCGLTGAWDHIPDLPERSDASASSRL